MPVFYSTLAWDGTALNFNAGFQTAHTTGSMAASPFTPFADPLLFDGVAYAIAAHTVPVETELTIDYGTTTDYIDGSGLTFDGLGNITGGTLQGIAQEANGTFTYAMAGCSVLATDFWAATQTAITTDDVAIFNAMLTGQDFILLANFADRFASGAGRDLIYGRGGADRIDAGADDDIVLAGTGSDRVTGGTGNDILFGDVGNDRLDGGDGRDFLAGEKGGDQLTGGKGPDFFVFSVHGGSDIVTDFVAADDQFIIRTGALSMADVTIQKVGSDTVISFADVSITLLNVARNQVSSADFIFGGNGFIDNAAGHFFAGWDYFA